MCFEGGNIVADRVYEHFWHFSAFCHKSAQMRITALIYCFTFSLVWRGRKGEFFRKKRSGYSHFLTQKILFACHTNRIKSVSPLFNIYLAWRIFFPSAPPTVSLIFPLKKGWKNPIFIKKNRPIQNQQEFCLQRSAHAGPYGHQFVNIAHKSPKYNIQIQFYYFTRLFPWISPQKKKFCWPKPQILNNRRGQLCNKRNPDLFYHSRNED